MRTIRYPWGTRIIDHWQEGQEGRLVIETWAAHSFSRVGNYDMKVEVHTPFVPLPQNWYICEMTQQERNQWLAPK